MHTLYALGFLAGLVAAVRIGWAIGSLFDFLAALPAAFFAALSDRFGTGIALHEHLNRGRRS
jgi:hypothetical protein